MYITFFTRRKRPESNSIEELFSGIKSEISRRYEIKTIQMPVYGAYPWKVIRNMLFAFKHRNNIIHITGDVHYIGIILGKRSVLTIHDVYSTISGSKFKRWYLKMLWFWLPAKSVKYITTISEFSKQELIKIIPFAAHKIRVVHNPYRKELTKYNKWHVTKPIKYPANILLIGTKSNKNLERVLPALQDLNVVVHIIGKLKKSQKRLLKLNELKYNSYFNISYEEVVKLYLKCDILCFPSLYEGFGMPIIEAQILGVPVITSNNGAMKEVAAESACLIDPYDEKAIRYAVIRIMEDVEYRDSLIAGGRQNISRFDPECIANQYIEIYKSLVNNY